MLKNSIRRARQVKERRGGGAIYPMSEMTPHNYHQFGL